MICKIQLHYKFAKKYASANLNNHQTPNPPTPGKFSGSALLVGIRGKLKNITVDFLQLYFIGSKKKI